jgi:carbon-monoxide dehydrogenase medium subunit
VKAPAFAYVKAASLPEVFDLLEQHAGTAQILAGGQSLLVALNSRLSAPELLIDITGLRELAAITVENRTVRIGALTTHSELERSALVREHLPLLARAVPHVAHVAIRNAGTFGGSIALADPAAEYPACALALNAQLVIAGRKGERCVAAREFFKGLYETDLQPGEVLVAAEFDRAQPGYRSVFLELARRRGDYAIVGLAACGKVEHGRFSDVRLAFLGAGATPVLATAASAALEGERCGEKAVAGAQAALAQDLDPPGDLYTSGPTKLHLARVLTGRALAALAS